MYVCLFQTLGIKQDISNSMHQRVTNSKKSKRAKIDEKSIHDVLRSFNGHIHSSTDEDDVEQEYDEIKHYIKADIIYPKAIPILTWWKNQSIIYPT